jgi:hypothetical protein
MNVGHEMDKKKSERKKEWKKQRKGNGLGTKENMEDTKQEINNVPISTFDSVNIKKNTKPNNVCL